MEEVVLGKKPSKPQVQMKIYTPNGSKNYKEVLHSFESLLHAANFLVKEGHIASLGIGDRELLCVNGERPEEELEFNSGTSPIHVLGGDIDDQYYHKRVRESRQRVYVAISTQGLAPENENSNEATDRHNREENDFRTALEDAYTESKKVEKKEEVSKKKLINSPFFDEIDPDLVDIFDDIDLKTDNFLESSSPSDENKDLKGKKKKKSMEAINTNLKQDDPRFSKLEDQKNTNKEKQAAKVTITVFQKEKNDSWFGASYGSEWAKVEIQDQSFAQVIADYAQVLGLHANSAPDTINLNNVHIFKKIEDNNKRDSDINDIKRNVGTSSTFLVLECDGLVAEGLSFDERLCALVATDDPQFHPKTLVGEAVSTELKARADRDKSEKEAAEKVVAAKNQRWWTSIKTAMLPWNTPMPWFNPMNFALLALMSLSAAMLIAKFASPEILAAFSIWLTGVAAIATAFFAVSLVIFPFFEVYRHYNAERFKNWKLQSPENVKYADFLDQHPSFSFREYLASIVKWPSQNKGAGMLVFVGGLTTVLLTAAGIGFLSGNNFSMHVMQPFMDSMVSILSAAFGVSISVHTMQIIAAVIAPMIPLVIADLGRRLLETASQADKHAIVENYGKLVEDADATIVVTSVDNPAENVDSKFTQFLPEHNTHVAAVQSATVFFAEVKEDMTRFVKEIGQNTITPDTR